MGTRSSMAAVVRAGRFGLCRNWKYQNAGAMFGRTLTTSKKNEETATINEKIASHSISDEAIASAAQKTNMKMWLQHTSSHLLASPSCLWVVTFYIRMALIGPQRIGPSERLTWL